MRRSAWGIAWLVPPMLALLLCSACARFSAPAPTMSRPVRSADTTASLLGTWVPRSSVRLQDRPGAPVVKALRFEPGSHLSVGVASSALESTMTGAWVLTNNFGVWLDLGIGPSARAGAFLVQLHGDSIRLTAIEGDRWATGVETRTVDYVRRR